MTASTLGRLGHEPVAAVAARRSWPTPGLAAIGPDTDIPGLPVIIAPDEESLPAMLGSLEPDLLLSWAFPWRLPEEVLRPPRYGAINYHPSLLPRHRGPNPVAWTIRMDDRNYGMTWHRMDAELDHGPILAQRSTPASNEDTIFDVVPRMCTLALRMLPRALQRLAEEDPGDPQPTVGATHAGPFGYDYSTIDWTAPRRSVHNQVRAWAFTPGTRSVVGPVGELDGQRVRVLRTTLSRPDDEAREVTCADGPVWVLESEPVES